MHRETLAGLRVQLGEQHPDTLNSMANLGDALRLQNKTGEAEVMIRTAMEGRRAQLGESHPSTLSSLNDFGNLLRCAIILYLY